MPTTTVYDLTGGAPPFVQRREFAGSPEDCVDLIRPVLRTDRESCVALMLDTRHRLIEAVVVSVGSIDHTFMSPRDILRDALLHNAAAMVVAHNHPSGDPSPSIDDVAITHRLAEACDLLGVPLLDHIIVGDGTWASLARDGVFG